MARTLQPRGFTRINPSHWVAPNVYFAWNGAVPVFNAASNTTAVTNTKNGITSAFSVYGAGLTFTAGTGQLIFNVPLETTAVTYFWVGKSSTAGALGRILSAYNGAGSGRFDAYGDSSNTATMFQALWSSQVGQWKAAAFYNESEFAAHAITYDGGATTNDPIFYKNGSVVTSSEVQAPSGSLVASSGKMGVGSRPDSTARQFEGSLIVGYAINRVLSAAEVVELSRNPWQLFGPDVRRLYFGSAAGGGTTTPKDIGGLIHLNKTIGGL
jgi:hypothetical protein